MIVAAVCPSCRSPLGSLDAHMSCAGCERNFWIEDGIPVLVVEDENYDQAQAAYFDEEVDAEFEIERPRGLPRLYEWLLREKFARAIRGLDLRDASVLVVCGGSGMDAEFLAEAGAEVVTTDISLGAAKRALARAQRHGVHLDAVVCDAKRLPFPDRSFYAVYVHDGLHHIEDPFAGLSEMMRVAYGVVVVTEPAEALLTSFAIKAGFALEQEDAGNRVERLRLEDVSATFVDHGFRVANAGRYAMLYRHEPGVVMRLFSHPLLRRIAQGVLRALDHGGRRFGNKLTIQGIRDE
jgi:SAM-dependent methyltransferase